MTSFERIVDSYHRIDEAWRSGGELNRRIGYAMVCDLLEALGAEDPSLAADNLRARLLELLDEINHSPSR